MAGKDFDLIIRGGTVYDGTGAAPTNADVGVIDGKIAAVEKNLASGADEVDAFGKIVTPGFVDVHTHYDGQAVWSDEMSPSSWNGVTTAVMSNCGVGFAPCRPEDRDRLIDLMEGVEDIPAPVMHEGLTWEWQSYPEYLDVLSSRQRDINICSLVPHAPVRVYVMGERALRLEPATEEDTAQMKAIITEGLRAGAFGVSTSRTTNHQSVTGDYTPTLRALEMEMQGIADAIRDAGHGFLELVTELNTRDVLQDFSMLRRVLERTTVPTYFSLTQNMREPELWRELMQFADDAVESGLPVRPVVAPRPIGMLLGFDASQNPFAGTATYQKLASLSRAEKMEELRKPEVKRRILSEDPMEFSKFIFLSRIPYSNMYRFGNPPNYTPRPEESIEAMAAAQNRPAPDLAYDVLLEDDGTGLIYTPFNNFYGNTVDACEEMLRNPNTVMGLGDGGAHVGFILDAGFPTWLLSYWVRDRGAFNLEEGIRRLTTDTASVAGLTDRGRIAAGMRADLNVIDFDELRGEYPYVTHDLPLGGLRLLQPVRGFDATIVNGQMIRRHGESTGAKPGNLLRAG